MDRELETAAEASAGGWLLWRRRHATPPGGVCANCGAILQGAYCHQCGQLADDFHRSLSRLFVEGLESLFDLDGRLWRTLPRLARDPGGLTRDFLDGHRAAQIPPLRMFLIVLLLVFFLGGLNLGDSTRLVMVIRKDHSVHTVTVGKNASPHWQADLRDDLGHEVTTGPGRWFVDRIVAAGSNPGQFQSVLETWAHRLAILMLPIGALLLSALFAFNRRFFVYDHLIFTMHSLSFQGLLASLFFLMSQISGAAAGLLLLIAPIHLFAHMRGVYRTGVIGTLARMTLLFAGSLIGFLVLTSLLVLIGLNAMTPH